MAVLNIQPKKERMDDNLPNKNEIIQKLNTLAINLNKATKEDRVNLLIDCFGDRFPNNSGESSKISVAPAIVTSAAPVIKQSINYDNH